METDEAKRDFSDLMKLEASAPDTWVGTSPPFPGGRIYGGLVVSQGLRAAFDTVEGAYRVHSLHAYFLRPGNYEEPIRYEVERLRDGRSFTTRRVLAHQSAGPILNLSASFQMDEEEDEVQLAVMPSGLPEPASQARNLWNVYLESHFNPEPENTRGHASAWIRVADCPPDDTVLQACALTYASDEAPMASALFAHPKRPMIGAHMDEFMSASLDHAIWYHRPGRAEDWMLHDVECKKLGNGRGLTTMRIFGRDGTHVATVNQEVLLRSRRN